MYCPRPFFGQSVSHPRHETTRRCSARCLVRALGWIALLVAAAGVSIACALGKVVPERACSLLGGFVGISPAFVHLPMGPPTSPPRRRWCFVAIFGMPTIALCIATAPWWQFALCLARSSASVGVETTWKFKATVNLLACLAITPIALVCTIARHPPSSYVRDAVWAVTSIWLVVLFHTAFQTSMHSCAAWGALLMRFLEGVALHLEGVVFLWNTSLMARRLIILEQDRSFGARHAMKLIVCMGIAFNLSFWTQVHGRFCNGFLRNFFFVGFSLIFFGIWVLFTTLVTCSLARNTLILKREAHRVHGAPRVEAMWASKVLISELVACLAIGVMLSVVFITLVPFRLLEWDQSRGWPDARRWRAALVPVHRAGHVISAVSVGVLSGLLWQAKEPACEDLRPSELRASSSSMGSDLEDGEASVWREKVEELATRGITLSRLLSFWACLTQKNIMPTFDPRRSTTNDVVRQAIIPMSRQCRTFGGGQALATVWSEGKPVTAQCMVTHSWSNLFLGLVAGILADALGQKYYQGIAACLLAEGEGIERLRVAIAGKGVCDRAYWICAFSVNQHAGICGGFGHSPASDGADLQEWEAKRRDSVTQEVFPLCPCRERKIFNDEPARCEMNKFDCMMQLMFADVPDFSHLVIVDPWFTVFSRAWCIAEIVEANRLGIPQRLAMHSRKLLDSHYDMLSSIDVRNCRAARAEDREMILAKIGDVEAFNAQLQWVIFGTQGILSKWIDGQQRAALVGRILSRLQDTDKGLVDRPTLLAELTGPAVTSVEVLAGSCLPGVHSVDPELDDAM